MKPQSIIVDKKEKGLVYYCYNRLTRKIYIGYTLTTLSRRIISHYHISKHNNSNNYFKNSLAKYPKDIFEWGVLYCSHSLEELKDREKYQRKQHRYLKRLLMFSISTYHLDFGTSAAMEHNVKRLCAGGDFLHKC